jgi:hypothetical protein
MEIKDLTPAELQRIIGLLKTHPSLEFRADGQKTNDSLMIEKLEKPLSPVGALGGRSSEFDAVLSGLGGN